jgi:putative protease
MFYRGKVRPSLPKELTPFPAILIIGENGKASPKKLHPELLAPAGSIEAFHAAIDAGADAIYCGVNDFNARLRARNFSMKMLSHLVPYAHGRRAKVFLARKRARKV